METSMLAGGWLSSQASSHGYCQSINQQIGHTEGLQTRPASRHGPLSLSLSLTLSLSPSLSLSLSLSLSPPLSLSFLLRVGSIQEVRYGRRQASNQETARRPANHLATQTSSWPSLGPDNQPNSQPQPEQTSTPSSTRIGGEANKHKSKLVRRDSQDEKRSNASLSPFYYPTPLPLKA